MASAQPTSWLSQQEVVPLVTRQESDTLVTAGLTESQLSPNGQADGVAKDRAALGPVAQLQPTPASCPLMPLSQHTARRRTCHPGHIAEDLAPPAPRTPLTSTPGPAISMVGLDGGKMRYSTASQLFAASIWFYKKSVTSFTISVTSASTLPSRCSPNFLC